MTDQELLINYACTTKEKVLSCIKKERDKIKKLSRIDAEIPDEAFKIIIEEGYEPAIAGIEKLIIPEQLPDGFIYVWYCLPDRFDLWMAHASVVDSFSFIELHRYEDITLDDTFGAILDQQFLLFSHSLPMIGPEEYAEKTGTQTDAVRQAIRRGKIKNARKVGKDWRIPRLAMYEIFRTYSRPYTYYWFGQLNDIPQKYDYLNNYSGLSIYTGDKELGDFGIVLCRPGEKKADTIFMSKSEKETLETILIGNPNIYYMFDIGHMLTERVKEVK